MSLRSVALFTPLTGADRQMDDNSNSWDDNWAACAELEDSEDWDSNWAAAADPGSPHTSENEDAGLDSLDGDCQEGPRHRRGRGRPRGTYGDRILRQRAQLVVDLAGVIVSVCQLHDSGGTKGKAMVHCAFVGRGVGGGFGGGGVLLVNLSWRLWVHCIYNR